MTSITKTSRQPNRLLWTVDHLIYEHSILLRMAIDDSTTSAYTLATNSYLTFCKLHGMPIDPTSETLSYYITFQSTHINPKSIESYLSGICKRSSLVWVGADFKFLLPAHKTDTMFKGNRVHIAHIIGAPDPKPIMVNYICSHDQLFPLHPQLWLCVNGFSLTCSWFQILCHLW
jgi:hypothetical protein